MKLRVYSHNDQYYFSVGGFSSMHHFFLSPSVKSCYSSVWEAHRDARRLPAIHAEAMKDKRYAAEDLSKPVVMDTSADEMMTNHYKEIFKILHQRSMGQHDEPEARKISYEEIKMVVQEILAVREKLQDEHQKKEIMEIMGYFRNLVHEEYGDLLAKDQAKKKKEDAEEAEAPATPDAHMPAAQPPAPQMPVTASKIEFPSIEIDVRNEMLEEYGSRICSVVHRHHPNCIYKINNDDIEVHDGKKILIISVNDNLNVTSIEPCGDLRDVFPCKSSHFYQRYWKPIFESVGHILLEDEGVLLAAAKISLPDKPSAEAKNCSLSGWDINADKNVTLDLSFVNDGKAWVFKRGVEKTAQSKFTQEDILKNQPARVHCTDKKLASIYDKYGEIVAVIPFETHAEYDINFGRKIVRLTEDQFELSDQIPTVE